MTPLKRTVAAAGAAALLALSLTACGDDGSDAPKSASKSDFCEVINSQSDVFSDIDPEASADDQAEALEKAFHDIADKLKDTGTPKDISDDARKGFEVEVDALSDIDKDDIKKAIEDQDSDALEGDISKDDQEKVQAFDSWATDYCADSATEGTE